LHEILEPPTLLAITIVIFPVDGFNTRRFLTMLWRRPLQNRSQILRFAWDCLLEF
jgi:hypothetical protein